MADVVNAQVVDALTIGNTKTVAEAAAFSMAQRFQDETAHARRVHLMAEAHLGKVLNNFTSVDPAEAVATAKLFAGASDSGLSSLLAQLATGQIGAKIGQSTPPESGVTSLLAQIVGLIATSQQSFNAVKS